MGNTEDDLVVVKVNVPREVLDQLKISAEKRGVSANTALVRALQRDLFLSENELNGAKILIENRDKTLSRVVSS